jgi:hypothetical protein
VVLEEDLERGAGKWYRDFHLGERAAAALRARYRKAGEVDGYSLYRPRSAASGAGADATSPAGSAAEAAEASR